MGVPTVSPREGHAVYEPARRLRRVACIVGTQSGQGNTAVHTLHGVLFVAGTLLAPLSPQIQ